jgi:hypothetical protein
MCKDRPPRASTSQHSLFIDALKHFRVMLVDQTCVLFKVPVK